VILAAGASRRMGSPKALLRLAGETFLDRAIVLFAAACESVVVVLGHQADEIRAQSAQAGLAAFVVNPEPERGQLSSLQTGLAAIPEGVDAGVFCPVDYAAVRLDTLRTLIAALAGSSAVFAIPRYRGERGHPVLFRASVLREFLALPDGAAARDLVHAYASRTAYVDVEDFGVLRDADTPEDYDSLVKAVEGR
jgi:molybdenum cofactor cytidylyltransferase